MQYNLNSLTCLQCIVSLPLENIREPYGFLMFSGVEKDCTGNKWVKLAIQA